MMELENYLPRALSAAIRGGTVEGGQRAQYSSISFALNNKLSATAIILKAYGDPGEKQNIEPNLHVRRMRTVDAATTAKKYGGPLTHFASNCRAGIQIYIAGTRPTGGAPVISGKMAQKPCQFSFTSSRRNARGHLSF